MLVASVITSVALVGVSALLRQALATEARIGRQWNNRASAESVAYHLADMIEHAVMVQDIPALADEPDQETSGTILTCMVSSPSGSGGLERRRYRWWPGENTEGPGTLELRLMHYAGGKNLTHPVANGEKIPDEEIWDQVPATIIGRGIDSLSIQFKPLNDPDANWQSHWQDTTNVMVRLRVTIETAMVELLVVPKANANLGDGGGN